MTKKSEKDKRKDFEKKKAKELNTDELIGDLQRLQAEFENYKKRVDKEKTEMIDYGKALLLKDLLSVVDNFEVLIKNLKDDSETSKAVRMVYEEMLKLLEKNEVKPIDSVNKLVDPFKHEVLMQKESEKDDGIIIEELQKGYLVKDKVLRTSKVCVSKKVNIGGNTKNG